MPRRSFRSGLLAGVFTGVAIALVRLLRSRRERLQMPAAPPSAWPRIVPPDEAAEPGMEAPAAQNAAPPQTPAEAPTPAATAAAATPSSPAATPGPAAGPGTITTQPAGRAEPIDTEPAAAEPGVGVSPTPEAQPEPTTVLEPQPLVEDRAAPTGGSDEADEHEGTAAIGDVTKGPAGRAEPLAQAWVEPDDDGCPDDYPIKVKLSSGIFHVPGGLNYARTKPDRCYASEAAAEADGFTKAKR